EDFISLISLHCYYNQLTSLNLSNNISLTELSCYSNELTSIDVTQNPALRYLKCCSNQLISLDVSKNPNLECLICTNNKLTTLDLSKNPNLTAIFCDYNELISLNIKNGNNSIFPSHTSSKQSLKAPLPPPSFNATNNPSLTCIQVDNETDANNGMVPYDRWKKDATATYSEDCQSLLGIDDEILSEGLNLYPNPVTNMLTINSKLSLEKIEVYSVLGQKVKEVNSNLKSISTDNLSRGIYFIKIYSEKGKAFRKLIKQ
ncbi:MAG: T9SS type A sorting domain-containing protein, partial [Bacteroidota bacterium]